MPLFHSKYQLAEPGIDPISNPVPHTGGGFRLSLTMLAGVGFGICMLFGLVIRPMLAAKAAPKPTAIPTLIATATSTTTATTTPTATRTITGTIAPTLPQLPAGFDTQPAQPVNHIVTQLVPIPVYQTVIVKVTVIIFYPQTVIVTQTFTPSPSPTPTEVYVLPTNTSSPTAIPPTATHTPTVDEPTATETETPTPTAPDLPSDTPGSQ